MDLRADLLATTAAFLLFLWLRRRDHGRARNPLKRPLPPGPPGLPILHNVLDWPQGKTWIKFSEWKESYGNLVHINLMGQRVIITNSLATAQDILNQSQNADRPQFIMAGELMGFIKSTILTPYNSYWKFTRKLTRLALSKSVISQYWPHQEEDAHMFVRSLLDNPLGYRDSLRYTIGKSILKTSYGLDVISPKDEYITISEETHHDLSRALTPGSFLVDVLPFLKYIPTWFPGAAFQSHAAKSRIRAWKMADKPYLSVKKAFEDGSAMRSFVSTLLEEEASLNSDPENWEIAVKWSAASLYGASTESSFAVLTVFFLVMAMYPAIQKKAQEEVDAVVGHGRLPSFDDRASLVYLDAVLKEVIRWHPPLPTGIAHRAMVDGYYQDYYIPEGSILIANSWAISREPELYHEPAKFCPERFIGDQPELNPNEWAFGFGKRICPGIHYASAFLYIMSASILSAFDIKALDDNGVDVEIEPKFSDNFNSYAEDFPCRITPRSALIADMLRKDNL